MADFRDFSSTFFLKNPLVIRGSVYSILALDLLGRPLGLTTKRITGDQVSDFENLIPLLRVFQQMYESGGVVPPREVVLQTAETAKGLLKLQYGRVPWES